MRTFLPHALMVVSLGLSGPAVLADGIGATGASADDISKAITVYANPDCNCCKHWMVHLQKHGYEVKTQYLDDMQAKKNELGIPGQFRSCHTGVINGLVVEGHVPASDITKTIAFMSANPNSNVAGVAVPGMPQGSPGMETGQFSPFATIGFTHDGQYGVISKYGPQ